MIEESGRVPSAPGSREPSPDGLAPSGFDPSRVVQVTRIAANITVEDQDASGMPTGDRYIWARHEAHPQLDTLLVTVHYSYAYLDNTSIRIVADKIARLISGRSEGAAADMEARIKAARNVIAYGYSRRGADGKPVNPLRNGEQCEHGRYEWEDCIGCYDEALLNALDGVGSARDSEWKPEGRRRLRLRSRQRGSEGHRPKGSAMTPPTKPVEQKARELLADRFWSNVEVRGSEECWPWLRGLNAGYPALRVDGKTRRASQVAWSLTNGAPFPKGMMACHRCDNPLCCNPGHIFVGTSADNVRDMIAKGRNQTIARRRAMTHCSNGHEYTPKNTRRFVRDGIWRRACRACQVAYVQKSFAKKSRSGVPHYRKEM